MQEKETLICRTAAGILAAAVFELFPNVQLMGGDLTSSGFFYDFTLPQSIHPEIHFQIEEKMRRIIQEGRPIRHLEMVAFSAHEFLKSKGHQYLADLVEGPGLFSIFQMESFADLCSGDLLSNSKEVTAFKLFPLIALDRKRVRVLGTARSSKEELKEFLKKYNSYSRRRHEEIGKAHRFWVDGIWLKEGLDAKERLLRRLKEGLFQDTLEVSCPSLRDRDQEHEKILEMMHVSQVGEIFSLTHREQDFPMEDLGWLDPAEGTMLQVTSPLKNITSSLQSIRKTLTILGFDCVVCLSGFGRKDQTSLLVLDAFQTLGWSYEDISDERGLAYVDFVTTDGLGRMWSAARIWIKESVRLQLLVERNLSLLLEKDLVNVF